MIRCPGCGCGNPDDAEFCQGCGEDLLPGDDLTCENCDGSIKVNEPFCKHCGIVLESSEGEFECEEHSKKEAVGFCIVCGKPICSECAQEKQHRLFCKKPDHAAIHHSWSMVFTTKNDYEADIAVANLENAGLKLKMFSFADHGVFVQMSEHSVAKVFVQKNQASRAKEILQKLDLLE